MMFWYWTYVHVCVRRISSLLFNFIIIIFLLDLHKPENVTHLEVLT